MTGDNASTSGRNDAGRTRPRRADTSWTKPKDGADFLTRALVTRAIRRAGAHQLLQGGACVLAVVVDQAEDTPVVEKGAKAVLRSSARNCRSDWQVVSRLPKRQDNSRRSGTDFPSEEADEAMRTIYLMDFGFRLSPRFEAMADGVANLGRPDWTLVKAAFRAVMGQSPASSLSPEMLAAIPLAAYGSAIRPRAGCHRALVRLRRLAETRLKEEPVARGPDRLRDEGPTIDDLHGLGGAAEWGHALAQDLRDYRDGRIRWCDVDRGILLSGPPGTGKTTFARALGRTCDVPVHIHSLAAWQARGYLNDLLKAMRAAFDKAKAAAPCVLFIDEIDSFGDREKLSNHNGDYNREVINALLECLDGAGGREGVVVVGATNHPEVIDAGIKRPGRLDRHIVIPLPDAAARVGILRHHLGSDLPEADLTPLAARLDGASGAALEQIVREGRRCARTSRRLLELADLESSLPPMVRLSAAAFRRSCVHEAGHLLAGLLLASEAGSTPLAASVSAEVLGTESGCTRFESGPGSDRTRSSYLAAVAVLLAGIAAERVLLGEAGPGGGGVMDSDLARATRLLAEIEFSYGLGEDLLFMVPANSSDMSGCLRREPELRHRIEAVLRSCMARSVSLLSANRVALVAVADVLCRHGRISAEEARGVLAPNP